MEIIKFGTTSLYENIEQLNSLSFYGKCGCDECTCYDKDDEHDACGSIEYTTSPDWTL